VRSNQIINKIVSNIFHKLPSYIEGPVELMLYIGASSAIDLSVYAALHPQQLILVEGDPDAAERLTGSLAKESACRVLSALITPDGVESPFYRYNLPFLNGTLPLGDLQILYPRLKLIEELALPSTTLSTLLETILVPGGGKRLLILDIPGQETAILESINPEQLQGFEWILVRGSGKVLQQGAGSLSASIARLEESLFKRVVTDEELDPAWPLSLLHMDRRAADSRLELEKNTRLLVEKTTESEQQAQRIAELESQLKSSQVKLDGAHRQIGEMNRRTGDIEAGQTQALKEASDREMAALAGRDNHARLLEEKITESQQQAQRIAELEAQLKSSQVELDGARGQLSEMNRSMGDSEAAKTQALKEASDREMAALNERDNHARLLEEARQAQREVLGPANERMASLEAQLVSQRTLVEVLSKGRSQQDKLYQVLSQERDGLLTELGALHRRIREMEELLSSQKSRGQFVDSEFQKAEGQIGLIKEIFLCERK
jgi:hypothetical protein